MTQAAPPELALGSARAEAPGLHVRQVLVALAAGTLFGVGLVVSGMAQPRKVLGFLDLAAWDPSLLCVMAGAVSVHFLAQRLVRKRAAPLYAPRFWLPERRDIDRSLVFGALIFGVGWGLSGYCPGPALASLPLGGASALVFVLGMLAGLLAGARWRQPSR